MKPTICLVTPALASANNGNWQTASRWARMLSTHYRVRLSARWDGQDAAAMIALHARRSADSIAAWAARPRRGPLVVVLTGTDLYRDIANDDAARRSLEVADRLVVLNEAGIGGLPAEHRAKARVCLQSCPARRRLRKPVRWLRAVMVGHLRPEKDPRTFFAAARLLAARADIRLEHIGGALDPVLAEEARSLAAEQPRYRWLGALPHARARDHIQRAHVLVHPSVLEGGAHVVIEALRSGTPVIASRIPGNAGLLGADYPATFEPGDAAGLAAWLRRVRDDGAMLAALQARCDARAPLFDPARERSSLLELMDGVMKADDEPPRETS